MTKPPKTDAEKARSRRSIVMALSLGVFVIVVFVITVVRMGGAGVTPANHF
jgi:hypothetical protein